MNFKNENRYQSYKRRKKKKVERLEKRLEQLKDSYQEQQPAIQDVRTKLLELKMSEGKRLIMKQVLK